MESKGRVSGEFELSGFYCISDWNCVNMAPASVYTKCVLGAKTIFTLLTLDNGWLSVPPTELCNYHDNHSKPDSAG